MVLPETLRFAADLIPESFYAAFRPALFATRVLDDFGSNFIFRNWQTRRYYGADVLWHDYLLFRCRNETDESVGRFVEMRNVVVALRSHCEMQGVRPDLDHDTILDGLCWLALEGGGKHQGGRQAWDSSKWRAGEGPNPGLNLLSAATYFSCFSLVKDLLGQGYEPKDDNELFPSPMYIAAWTGQAAMLELMQEYMPDYEELRAGKPGMYSRSKVEAQPLYGAAIRGDMDMVRLALYPPSRTIPPDNPDDQGKEGYVPGSELVLGFKPGHIPMGTKLRAYTAAAMRNTSSPAVYRYLRDFLGQLSHSPLSLCNPLAEKALVGDMVMVRYLLDDGADVVGKDANKAPPLLHAVRSCHEDIVDLLLERGADPNEWGSCHHGTVLTAAAKAGSLRILQKLVDAGAKMGSRRESSTLRYAVELEHTAMVELLLRMGVGGEKERRRIMGMAKDDGLESMVEVMESWEQHCPEFSLAPPPS